MKKRFITLVASFSLIVLIGGVPVYAQVSPSPSSSPAASTSPTTTSTPGSCGSTKTQLISCDSGTQTGLSAINDLIKITLIVLSAMIGVVAVAGLTYAAIIYASARDNQEQINNARTIIRNIIIGLVLYVFTVVIINWLIPGGVIGGGASN